MRWKWAIKELNEKLFFNTAAWRSSWLRYCMFCHNNKFIHLQKKITRVECPNFGHTAVTSSFFKYKYLQEKKWFERIVNCQFWNIFIFQMVIYHFRRMPTAATNFVLSAWRTLRIPDLGQGVRIKARYPNRSWLNKVLTK